MTLQLKTECRIKETGANSEMLVFEFQIGPLHIRCLANIPREGEQNALVYIHADIKVPRSLDLWEPRKEKEVKP
jgi:hypothetical protein